MARHTTFSVRVPQGGRLLTNVSSENVGVGNYSTKTNWRRLDDSEVLREGTALFRPNVGLPLGSQPLNLSGVDIVGAWEAIRPNGDRAVVVATPSTIYKFDYTTGTWSTIGSGFSGNFWQGEKLDGYLILNNEVDLPVTYRVEDSAVVPIYEMRDLGIAAVGCIGVYNGFLLCGDITEIQSTELNAWMSGLTPYGIVPSDKTNRIQYKIAWSDFGAPRNWSPVIHGVIESATKNKVTLDYPAPFSFPVGTKLAVIGAGPNGTTLGGQVGLDDGVPVLTVAGPEVTFDAYADASLTYPLSVQVTRFADTSTFVGSSSIKDDSSGVLAIKALKQIVVVYRTTGVWVGRYTGSVDNPFVFKPAYTGANVLAHKHTVADVEGGFHVFAGQNTFYMFDGASNPEVFEPLHDAAPLFFTGLSGIPFASTNLITREIWMHNQSGVVAYDLKTKTVSYIDEAYTAAVIAQRPGGTEKWFILARAGKVLQYGATDTGTVTVHRLGQPVDHIIEHGEVSLNDDENEKDLLSYLPLMSSVTDPLIVSLYGRDNIPATPELLCAVTVSDPQNYPLVETFYRNIYFKDRLTYRSVTDTQAAFSGVTYTFQGIGSQGVTRNGPN